MASLVSRTAISCTGILHTRARSVVAEPCASVPCFLHVCEDMSVCEGGAPTQVVARPYMGGSN
eukprot:1137659-Lingulodinium_polyedra.AAC.1